MKAKTTHKDKPQGAVRVNRKRTDLQPDKVESPIPSTDDRYATEEELLNGIRESLRQALTGDIFPASMLFEPDDE
jgi:hypothetical protein